MIRIGRPGSTSTSAFPISMNGRMGAPAARASHIDCTRSAVGRSVVYFNCNVLPLFKGVSEINPTVNLLVSLLKPPTGAECQQLGLTAGGGATKATAASRKQGSGSVLSGLSANPLGARG